MLIISTVFRNWKYSIDNENGYNRNEKMLYSRFNTLRNTKQSQKLYLWEVIGSKILTLTQIPQDSSSSFSSKLFKIMYRLESKRIMGTIFFHHLMEI